MNEKQSFSAVICVIFGLGFVLSLALAYYMNARKGMPNLSSKTVAGLMADNGSGARAIEKDRERLSVDDTVTINFEDLLDAIEWQESRGITNAVGDRGRAVGAYQITKMYVDDVNRISSGSSPWASATKYDYDDCWNKKRSRAMTWLYIDYYSKHAINSNPELLAYCSQFRWFEMMARIHNGGPDGWRDEPQWFVRNRGYTLAEAKRKIENTSRYWAKIKARLEGGPYDAN